MTSSIAHQNYTKPVVFNKILGAACVTCSALAFAQAGIIYEFTGGDVTNTSGVETTGIDGDVNEFDNTVKYVEDSFEMTVDGGSITVGNYYGGGNAVIHGHWSTMDRVVFNNADGSAFDLNYYKLTSNPSSALNHGGASGDAVVSIIASEDGTNESFRVELPPEDWGDESGGDGSVTEVYLGPEFDGIKAFWFESDKDIFQCFGMDTFYIDLTPPPPSTDNPIILGSGTVEDAVSGSTTSATPVPTLPFYGLLALGGLLGLFGFRKLKA